jgi:hypothetical protein
MLGYRAGRVRVIFRLPNHLRYFYPHHLVHVELFGPFNPNPSPSHGLYSTSPALHDGRRCLAIIPISDVVLACHLAPVYSFLSKDTRLDNFSDLLSIGRRFFFNHYASHFVFLFIRYWRRIIARRSAQLAHLGVASTSQKPRP